MQGEGLYCPNPEAKSPNRDALNLQKTVHPGHARRHDVLRSHGSGKARNTCPWVKALASFQLQHK